MKKEKEFDRTIEIETLYIYPFDECSGNLKLFTMDLIYELNLYFGNEVPEGFSMKVISTNVHITGQDALAPNEDALLLHFNEIRGFIWGWIAARKISLLQE